MLIGPREVDLRLAARETRRVNIRRQELSERFFPVMNKTHVPYPSKLRQK